MIDYFYFRKNGKYSRPLYYHYYFWLGLCLVAFIVSNTIFDLLRLEILLNVSFFSVVAGALLIISGLVWMIFRLFKTHGSLWSVSAVEAMIRNNLFRTKVANRLKNTDYIRVPAVLANYDGQFLDIRIKKIAGYESSSIDELKELINSSLNSGNFKNFAVVSGRVSDSGLWFYFKAQDVASDLTFRPRTIADLVQEPYLLKLQKDLVINLADRPHLAVWGASGSGKTTVLMAMLAQFLSSGTDVRIIDGKNEFSSFSLFYPRKKIVSTSVEILQLLHEVCTYDIPLRQKIIANAVKKQKKLGLRGYDIGLRPLVIMADEVGSIVGSLNNKDKKLFNSYLGQIAQKGRSISVFLVMASQSPAVDVVPQSIRAQFSTKILLGSASGDIQRMAFGQAVSVGEVEKFTGYYSCDGLTVEPQKYFVPDLFANDLSSLRTFEALYKKGMSNNASI